MSKIKNTPEFQKMMDEQELAQSFHYQEQEQEKEQLLQAMAMDQEIEQATDEYIQAQKVFIEAQRKFAAALDAYANLDNGLTVKKKADTVATAMLTNMFKGFDPNS